MGKNTFTILSIEDNEPDFVILERALNRIEDLTLKIINITSGEKALEFMYKKGEYKSSPTPNLILLDINLPLIDGKEILKTLKNDKKYKVIPIIMFSTSDYSSDIEESYRLHANSYITKTFDIKELFRKISHIGEYWLKTNTKPEINNIYFIQNLNKGE